MRWCIDFWKLNNVTFMDAYLLQDSCFDCFSCARLADLQIGSGSLNYKEVKRREQRQLL